jgi:hypothetical protein
MSLTLPTYTWRGKTYRSLGGLCRAVEKRHPGGAVSFGPQNMFVRVVGLEFSYKRRFIDCTDSLIADEPS